MEKDLRALFAEHSAQVQKAESAHDKKMKLKWDADRKAVEDIYGQIEFLTDHGVRIEKMNVCAYDPKEARVGFFPYLRLPQFLILIYPPRQGKDLHVGLMGDYSFEEFIKYIAGRIGGKGAR